MDALAKQVFSNCGEYRGGLGRIQGNVHLVWRDEGIGLVFCQVLVIFARGHSHSLVLYL